MIFYYYLGNIRPLTFISYVFAFLVILSAVNSNVNKTKSNELFSILIFVLVLIFSLFTFNTVESYFFSLRLYFGLFIFLFAFKFLRLPNIDIVARFLAILTVIEKASILLYPDLIYKLNNYDGGVTFSLSEASNIFGGVHSFGANRTVSAVILLVFYIVLDFNNYKNKTTKYFLLFSSFVCVSGTAMFISFLYFTYKAYSTFKFNKRGFFILPASIIIIYFLNKIFFVSSFEDVTIHRFSSLYYEFIIEYKNEQILDLYNALNKNTFFWGMGSSSMTSFSNELGGSYGSRYGDFILLDFFSRYGLIGLICFILMILLNINTTFGKVVFWILFIGTLHYHVLFSGPSQVLLAYLFRANKSVFA